MRLPGVMRGAFEGGGARGPAVMARPSRLRVQWGAGRGEIGRGDRRGRFGRHRERFRRPAPAPPRRSSRMVRWCLACRDASRRIKYNMETNKFANRHIGVTTDEDKAVMLQTVGVKSTDELINQIIPSNIRLRKPLHLPAPMTERKFAEHIAELASKNKIFTSYIGMGWYDTVCPALILRNVFENPSWYTSYTPYQAEVSQGRLEALFNFQTVICELTGMPLTNCSLLDEATAAAEAATMLFHTRSREQVKNEANQLFVDENVFESTLAVIQTRMAPQGIEVVTGNYREAALSGKMFGAILQYPDGNGTVNDYKDFVAAAHAEGIRVAVAADLMSLVLLTPPGEWGADIVFGTSQRFGIP